MRLALLLTASLVACRSAPSAAPEREAPPYVRVSLIPGVTHSLPDRSVVMAVSLDIPEGWHIYWLNPGDAGLPTTVTVEGGRFEPARWPMPKSIPTESGVTWGYEGSVTAILFGTSTGLGVVFKARATWLLCRDICIPGEGSAVIELPPGEPSSTEILDDAIARLPREANALRGVTTSWRVDEDAVTLIVTSDPPRELELFVLPEAPALYRDQTRSGGVLTVRFQRPDGPVTGVVEGVLRVDDAGYELSVPWPS